MDNTLKFYSSGTAQTLQLALHQFVSVQNLIEVITFVRSIWHDYCLWPSSHPWGRPSSFSITPSNLQNQLGKACRITASYQELLGDDPWRDNRLFPRPFPKLMILMGGSWHSWSNERGPTEQTFSGISKVGETKQIEMSQKFQGIQDLTSRLIMDRFLITKLGTLRWHRR